tara:strand:+ start:430 stop:1023 length:594 start_codon:yes stop_codon:yes gene_type:complete
MKKVQTYFDKKSFRYQKKSNSFPWKLIRDHEKNIVFSLMGNIKNLSIADVGSGSGFYTEFILKQKPKKVYAIDNSSKMLAQIQNHNKKIKKILQNIETLKLNQKFDKIISAGLIEFVKKPIRVFENIHKISKKNSTFILLCPKDNLFGKVYKFFHSLNKIDINLFSIDQLNHLSQKTGWKIIKKESFLFSTILKMRK